jgi:CRP-like cAMP-binding protein
MRETLTLIEKTAILKTSELLGAIPSEALARLAARGREIHLDPGEVFFREGEANRGAFLVIEGLVEIRKGRALVSMRHTGDSFGELALNEGEPHEFTATATDHTHVLVLSNEDLFETMLEYPEVGLELLRGFARRLAELAQRIHHLEGHIAHLSSSLKDAGVQPTTYQSGAYPRPDFSAENK